MEAGKVDTKLLLLNTLEGEIRFIQRTWLNRYDITTDAQRETARKWVKALETDIQMIKDGNSSMTLEDLIDAQLKLQNEYEEKALQGWCDGVGIDRDTLTWHHIIDCVVNSILW